MKSPKGFFLGMIGKVRLEVDGSMTHLQKYSPLGFLVTWPFCFHFWMFWHKQEQRVVPGFDDPVWLAGTERGIYFRTPGYRYDNELGMKWTWGYIGGHWD